MFSKSIQASRLAWLVAVSVTGSALAPNAQAIIIRHDRPDARYRDLGEEYRPYLVQMGMPDGEGVKRLYGGMGTMIAPTWVLTAGHVADRFKPESTYPVDMSTHEVWVMGRAYRIKSVHLHPRYRRGDADYDIALVELATAPSNARIACLYSENDEQGQVVTNVGAGVRGNGLIGVGQPDGALRGGTATIDRAERTLLSWRFRGPEDAGVTDLEGISGPGDSGGPAMISKAGRPCVAGVSGSQRRKIGRAAGTYGVEEVYARVSVFRPWIEDVMAGRQPRQTASGGLSARFP